MNKSVQKLVVAVTGVDNQQVLERWQFDLEVDKETTSATYPPPSLFSSVRLQVHLTSFLFLFWM